MSYEGLNLIVAWDRSYGFALPCDYGKSEWGKGIGKVNRINQGGMNVLIKSMHR